MSQELKGFCHPRSPEGRSQLIGEPPWYFSYDMMLINYRADVEQVKKHIPSPLEPALMETDGCSIRFNNFVSVWDSDKELIFQNPERTHFKETIMSAHCRLKEREVQKITYIWVDNDFTLLRGWFMGAPKKFGRTHMSFEKRHLYSMLKSTNGFGTGTKLGAFCEAHGERMVAGEMILGEKITPDKLPESMKREIINDLHFPSIEMGATEPLVHLLVEAVSDVELGDVWECSDAKLHFYESDIEEHTSLKPVEITSAYFINMSLTINGMKVLHKY